MSTLLIVTGAPGVGKTTTLEQCLAVRPQGRQGVAERRVCFFDIDWLLEAGSQLAGEDIRYAPARWPAYNTIWLRTLEGVFT